jgi:hypothetical protein
MGKPTFLCCLDHKKIRSQELWIQVSDEFFDQLGGTEEVHLIFTSCDICKGDFHAATQEIRTLARAVVESD